MRNDVLVSIMKNSTSKAQTPFRNLKFFLTANKALGLVSCKLINGRLKQSTVRSRCYCMFWFLFHCAYSSLYYYTSFVKLPDVDPKARKYFELFIVRFSGYFASLLPYNYVAAFRGQDFVKLSNKLEAYDDRVIALGHPRKDRHVFIWVYFVYTTITITMNVYDDISESVAGGALTILKTVCESGVPIVTGTYCIFITCIYLDLVRQRFRHLNETIIPRVSQLPVTGSHGEITVYDVRYLHGVLVDSAELIDTLYGLGTLLTFGSVLFEFVTIIYTFLTEVEDNAAVLLLDLFFQVFYLFAMYHVTAYEANRVEERVVKYGLSSQYEKCHMEKLEMTLYFYHKRFTFTAAGFFVVDLTILFSIATTVTTCLTLIV